MRCLWCNQPLQFVPGAGWTHPDGAVVVTRDGRDDHVATPDYGSVELNQVGWA